MKIVPLELPTKNALKRVTNLIMLPKGSTDEDQLVPLISLTVFERIVGCNTKNMVATMRDDTLLAGKQVSGLMFVTPNLVTE